tara:strand:- start:916 stop:1233 length:318 start_codon:yes stop_codon:yes gene_type:complete
MMNTFLSLTATVALLVLSMANADTFQVKFNIANLDGKKGNKGSFVMEIHQEWVSVVTVYILLLVQMRRRLTQDQQLDASTRHHWAPSASAKWWTTIFSKAFVFFE